MTNFYKITTYKYINNFLPFVYRYPVAGETKPWFVYVQHLRLNIEHLLYYINISQSVYISKDRLLQSRSERYYIL